VYTLESMLHIFTRRCFTDFFTRNKFNSLGRLILKFFGQLFQNYIVDLSFLQTLHRIWTANFLDIFLHYFVSVCIRGGVRAVPACIELDFGIQLHF